MVKCYAPGCGAHGTCDENVGYCDCEPGWSGYFCQNPPPSNVPCTPSDAAFKKEHGGDLACGNWGQYGTCNSSGLCDCGAMDVFYGNRCQNPCRNDLDCGGSAPATIERPDREIGRCDSVSKTCVCANGWSGAQCRTPAPDARCIQDQDCYWGGTQRGTCDPTTGACVCQKDASGRPLYEGTLCQTVVKYEGAACETEKDCKDKTNKCVDKKCVSPTGTSKPALGEIIGNVVESLFTPESLAFLLTDKVSETLIETTLETAISGGLKKLIIQNVDDIVSRETVDTLARALGEKFTAKVIAELMTKEAAEMTVKSVIDIAATRAVGTIMGLANMIQIWGVYLDVSDVLGLNLQMMQSTLDQLKTQFQVGINASPALVEAGVSFPYPFYPEYSVPFRIKTKDYKLQQQVYTDLTDYLSRLTVNSDGQVIVPMFNNPADVALNEKKQKYKSYWAMANDNVNVFNNLVQYGWVIWLLAGLAGVMCLVVVIMVLKDQGKLPIKR